VSRPRLIIRDENICVGRVWLQQREGSFRLLQQQNEQTVMRADKRARL